MVKFLLRLLTGKRLLLSVGWLLVYPSFFHTLVFRSFHIGQPAALSCRMLSVDFSWRSLFDDAVLIKSIEVRGMTGALSAVDPSSLPRLLGAVPLRGAGASSPPVKKCSGCPKGAAIDNILRLRIKEARFSDGLINIDGLPSLVQLGIVNGKTSPFTLPLDQTPVSLELKGALRWMTRERKFSKWHPAIFKAFWDPSSEEIKLSLGVKNFPLGELTHAFGRQRGETTDAGDPGLSDEVLSLTGQSSGLLTGRIDFSYSFSRQGKGGWREDFPTFPVR